MDRCGWWATLPDPGVARRLEGARSAHCVVVGAGFTGLAAARWVAEQRPDWEVVVLEAGRVGGAASGRNAGAVGRLRPWAPRLGASNEALQRVVASGFDDLSAQVRDRAIPCGWRAVPRLAIGLGVDSGLARACRAEGAECEPADAEAVRALTGCVAGSALRTEICVAEPVSLVRGLAAVLPENAIVHEASPVTAIRSGTVLEIESTGGRVRTQRLLLATNGATPRLGFPRARTWPVHTFSSLSRPASERQRAALGQTPEWVLVREGGDAATLRCTGDGRIFIRHGLVYRPRGSPTSKQLADARRDHARIVSDLLPALRDLDLEFTWSGVLAMTANGVPWFGELGRNAWGAGAYSGNGIALGTALGRLLAERALGLDSALSREVEALPAPPRLPPGMARLYELLWRR